MEAATSEKPAEGATPSQTAVPTPEPPDTLYGLYLGTPITERQWGDGNREPDQIVLYQGPEDDFIIRYITDALSIDETNQRIRPAKLAG